MEDKKISFKMSKRQKKYVIAEIIIAILGLALLVFSKIFNFDDNIVIKILEIGVLASVVILNILVLTTKE